MSVPRLASVCDADGVERSTHRRCLHAGRSHQLAQEQPRLRVRDRRLHAYAHETVGIIDRQPRMRGQSAAAIVGVAIITHVDLCTCIHEGLNDVGAPFVRRAMERQVAIHQPLPPVDPAPPVPEPAAIAEQPAQPPYGEAPAQASAEAAAAAEAPADAAATAPDSAVVLPAEGEAAGA